MIRLINSDNQANNAHLLEQMYRLRKSTFQDHFRWKLNVGATYEIDNYDMLQPLYLLALDDDKTTVLGALRLLPTMGPNMLADIFSDLLPNSLPFRRAKVWESSRYCVDTSDPTGWTDKGIHKVTAELMLALCEVGIDIGLDGICAVVDTRMERILKRLNCSGQRLGTPRSYGEVMVVASMWDTSLRRLQTLRQASDINFSVLERSVV